MSRVTCSLLLLLLLVTFVRGDTQVNEELSIPSLAGPRRHLMVRPVPAASDQLQLNISLELVDADVTETYNKVTLGGWLSLSWVDHRLAWSEGNVKYTRASPSDIWVPDLTVYNSMPVTADWVSPTPAIVYASGKVLWIPPVSFTVRCQRSQTDSKDRISCPFEIGSWTHSVDEIDLLVKSNQVDTNYFLKNGRWVVESSSLVRAEKLYSCCPEKYVTMVGEVVLKPQRS